MARHAENTMQALAMADQHPSFNWDFETYWQLDCFLRAHPEFQLVVSYNPSPLAREMKSATRQRFCALAFSYPAPEREAGMAQTGLVASPLTQQGKGGERLAGDGFITIVNYSGSAAPAETLVRKIEAAGGTCTVIG